MAGNNAIQILRGSGHDSAAQLQPGQPYYDYTNNKLYIGGRNGTAINQAQAIGNEVTSVNGKTGNVYVTKSDVNLGNVDNVKQYSASNPPPIWETGESERLNLDFSSEYFTKTFDSSYRAIFVTVTDASILDQQSEMNVKVEVGRYTFTEAFKESTVGTFSFCVLTSPVYSKPSDIQNPSRCASDVFIIHRTPNSTGVTVGTAAQGLDYDEGLTIKVSGDGVAAQEAYIYVTYNALRLL